VLAGFITFFNGIRATGEALVEAMLQAATRRTRAVLMTAFSAIIGLLPAAFSTAIGSQVQRPLAIVVVCGMLIGPILLLLVVPAPQTLFAEGGAPAESLAERAGTE
jgi:cobalt-zinc-cadmium resistance protein CzcA